MKKTILILLLLLVVILSYGIWYKQKPKSKIDLVISRIEVNISSLKIQQGDYIKVIINNFENNNDIKLDSNIADNINNEIYLSNNHLYAYIPVKIALEPKIYYIKVYENNLLSHYYNVNVVNSVFLTQNLTIDPAILKSTTSNEAIKEYNETVVIGKSYNIKEKLFEDNFIMPTGGEITTEFGLKRYTNGSKNPSRHFGIDMANDLGTPIKAVASGKITIARKITSAGNFIIIDHGMGLFSYYAHMNSLNVAENASVKQGDIIGYMGSTGFATGPHLHFAMTFKDTYTNPWNFFHQ